MRGTWSRSELQEAASEDRSALRCGPGVASDRERVVPSQGLAGGGELSSGHSSGWGFVLLLLFVNYYKFIYIFQNFTKMVPSSSFVSSFFGFT